jgi:multidrug resistance efflux pump
VEIRAPAAGFILVRNISPGQRFDSGNDLYVIGDLTNVWILADVFESEAKWLHPGDKVRVVYQGENFSAVVSEVLPIFDAEARTMKMRLTCDRDTVSGPACSWTSVPRESSAGADRAC